MDSPTLSCELTHSINVLKIYNYQGPVNEDYNIVNTPAPIGKLTICFGLDKFDLL